MAHGGACLQLHADEGACYSLKENKIVKGLEESMGWGYDQPSGHITYGTDQCIWPQYGLPIQGVEVVGTTCSNPKPEHKWKQKALGDDHDGYYQYVHERSGRCLSMKKDKAVLQKCNAGDGKQHWNFGGIALKK
jgi:hypothetical protein